MRAEALKPNDNLTCFWFLIWIGLSCVGTLPSVRLQKVSKSVEDLDCSQLFWLFWLLPPHAPLAPPPCSPFLHPSTPLSESLALRALPVARVHNNNLLTIHLQTILYSVKSCSREGVLSTVLSVSLQDSRTQVVEGKAKQGKARQGAFHADSTPSFLLHGFTEPSSIHTW